MDEYAMAIELTNQRIDAFKKAQKEIDLTLSNTIIDLMDHILLQAKVIEMLAEKLDMTNEIEEALK